MGQLMQQVIARTAPKNKSNLIIRISLVLAGLILAATVVLVVRWPFRLAAVVKQLQEEGLGKVEVGEFHQTYFPRPGCVLQKVRFQHNPKPGAPPLITIETVRIEGSFSGLFAQHVKRIRTDCDADVLLIDVEQVGAACHDGYYSCFYREHQMQGDWKIVGKKPE